LTDTVIKKYRDEWLKRVIERRNIADRVAVSLMVGTKRGTEVSTAQPLPASSAPLLTYVESLPELKSKLLEKAQPEWDSGVTARMVQANYDYIDALEGILISLASYYPPGTFSGKEPHEYFSEMVSSRFQWHRAHLEPAGPGSGGTIVNTICGGHVSDDIEKMVVDMVMSLVGYNDEFNWKSWNRKWSGKAT